MTSHLDDTEAFIARRLQGTSALPLFDPPPVAEMPGAGQSSRRKARERVGPTSAEKRHTIALLIEAMGPLTRNEIADATNMSKDSVNGRVREGCLLPEGHEDRLYTEGERDGRSLVHLFRLRKP